MNQEMKRFVEHYGNQRKAADAIHKTPEQINMLLHHKRDFSADMLRRIKCAWPAIDLDALLEVDDYQLNP